MAPTVAVIGVRMGAGTSQVRNRNGLPLRLFRPPRRGKIRPRFKRRKEHAVRIDVRGRNAEVTDELRGHVQKRFARVGRQVSPLATLEVTLSEERNPAISDCYVAEAT